MFISEAVAQEREAEGTVWSFSFLTTRWRDCGGIIMEDFMMLQVYGSGRLCPQILSSKIFYVLAPPQVVWLPTHLSGFLYISFHHWMFPCRSQDYGSFPQGPVRALRILLCLCHLFTHLIPQHTSVIQFFILLPAPLESSNSRAHFNSG